MKGRRNNGEDTYVSVNNGEKRRLRRQIGRKADGKIKILTVTAPTKAECLKKMKRKEAEW